MRASEKEMDNHKYYLTDLSLIFPDANMKLITDNLFGSRKTPALDFFISKHKRKDIKKIFDRLLMNFSLEMGDYIEENVDLDADVYLISVSRLKKGFVKSNLFSFVGYMHVASSGIITSCYLHPALRNRGIMSSLILEHVMQGGCLAFLPPLSKAFISIKNNLNKLINENESIKKIAIENLRNNYKRNHKNYINIFNSWSDDIWSEFLNAVSRVTIDLMSRSVDFNDSEIIESLILYIDEIWKNPDLRCELEKYAKDYEIEIKEDYERIKIFSQYNR